MKSIKATRAYGFIIDYVFWYLLMYLMILFYFFAVEKQTAFSGDLKRYADIFSTIMKKDSFLIIYAGALLVYEIFIPLCFGGQSISKKILKIKIEPFSAIKIIIRGCIRLVVINPCGVVSYLVASLISGSASMISDGLWIVLIINIVLVCLSKPALYDMVNKTKVIYTNGEKE